MMMLTNAVADHYKSLIECRDYSNRNRRKQLVENDYQNIMFGSLLILICISRLRKYLSSKSFSHSFDSQDQYESVSSSPIKDPQKRHADMCVTCEKGISNNEVCKLFCVRHNKTVKHKCSMQPVSYKSSSEIVQSGNNDSITDRNESKIMPKHDLIENDNAFLEPESHQSVAQSSKNIQGSDPGVTITKLKEILKTLNPSSSEHSYIDSNPEGVKSDMYEQCVEESSSKKSNVSSPSDENDVLARITWLSNRLHPPQSFLSQLLMPTKVQVNYVEVGSHPSTIRQIPWVQMNDEWYRLISFAEYPKDSRVSAIKLAAKGFALLGSDFKIICFFCAAKIEMTDDEESIDEEHKRLTMDCPMITGAHCNNRSIKNRLPNKKATDILSHFGCIPSERQENLTSVSNDLPAGSLNEDIHSNASFSQPSNENASHANVTSTSDLAESDATAMQASQQSIQSSQLMDDSPALQNQQESSSQISIQDGQSSESSSVQQNDTQTSEVSSNQQNNTQGSEGSSVQQNTQQSEENSKSNDGNSGQTYEKLGIITARPKRERYAHLRERMDSFLKWPEDHHVKPNDLSNAGFFYSGYSDCARCFFCGGGLRNWEAEDNVWVEHARWFPKCAFLLQVVGKDFIDVVQKLNKDKEQIKYEDVIQEMPSNSGPTPLNYKERSIVRDPAVICVASYGFEKEQVIKSALEISQGGGIVSSDKLYQAVVKKTRNISLEKSISARKGDDEKRLNERLQCLGEENNELRLRNTCKVCWDKDVTVVFLPCGHLACCTDCSCALTMCPLCRVPIKGIVKAYL